MIYCIAGLLGGGKSFYAVERMARHISSGGICYSNIRLELDPWYNSGYTGNPTFRLPHCYPGALRVVDDSGNADYYHDEKGFVYNARGFRYYLRDKYSWELQPGQYFYLPDEQVGPDLPSVISGGSTDLPVVVVLDEALDHFESGSSSADSEFRSFLRHVRKLGIDLYFIAQDFGSLDRRIRALCHYTVNCRDLATWRAPVIGVPLPPPWRWNIQVLEWHSSDYGKISCPPVNRDKLHYRDPLVFGSYSSTGLHRAFPLRQARSDFRGVGRIQESEVPMWCKVLCVLNTLILVFLLFWAKLRPVAASVATLPDLSPRISALETAFSAFSASTNSAAATPPEEENGTLRPIAIMNNSEKGGWDVWYEDGTHEHSAFPVDVDTLELDGLSAKASSRLSERREKGSVHDRSGLNPHEMRAWP